MAKDSHKGGQPPFGYAWQDGELVINPLEAPIVTEIFTLFLLHQRKGTVAKLISTQGHRTRNGNEFKYSAISRILTNPAMKGIHRYSVAERGTGKNIQYEQAIEPIVPAELWDQVATILQSKTGTKTRPPAQDYFPGRVFCGCQTSMEIPSKSKGYACRTCGESIEIEALQTVFEHWLRSLPFPHLEDPSSAISAPRAQTTDPAATKRISRQIDRLFELHAAAAITAEEFSARHQKLKQQLTALESTQPVPQATPLPPFQTMQDCWQSLERAEKQALSECLIDRIEVVANTIVLQPFQLLSFAQEPSPTAP